jgi:Phosphoesterase family/Bacterial Ig-like domain/Secretion system C-terminal sorting domain
MKSAYLIVFLFFLCLVAKAQVPAHDRVVVVFLENRSYVDIIGFAGCPYINSLINNPALAGAVFTQSYGLARPSQPNYIHFFSGSAQGVDHNSTPSGLPFTTPNLGASLIAQGKDFITYSEGLPSVGYAGSQSGTSPNLYVRRHNPMVNWQGAATNGIPETKNQPFTAFPTDFNNLPTVSFVVPNLANAMHLPEGDRETGDAWLAANLDAYVQWAKVNNSLFILTFDESEEDRGGVNDQQITTLFVGENVRPGQYDEYVDHHYFLRTLEDMFGLPHAGNSTNVPPIAQVWLNPTKPTVAISSSSMQPTNLSSISVSFTFSESVTGFDLADIAVTNATIGNFSGSGANYTAFVSPSNQGVLTVSVPADAATNGSAIGNFASLTLIRLFDNIRPTVEITSTAPATTNTSPIPLTFTFNEDATGFTLGDINVTGGTASDYVKLSRTVYTANITPTGQGTVTVNIPSNRVNDYAANGNIASADFIRVYDTAAPTVDITSTAAEPTNVSPIPITITFNEAVTGFDAGDLDVSNGAVGNFAGSGTAYTANVTPTTSGAVTVSVAAGKASDAAGNMSTASNTFTRTYAIPSNQTITFGTLADKTLGDAPFGLSATASSSLPVSFSSPSDKIAITGSQVTMSKAGSVTITANQAGNFSFNPAPSVSRSFCINPAKPTIAMTGADTETVVLTSSGDTGNQWFLNGLEIPGATAKSFSANTTGVYTVQVTIETCASVKATDFPVVITGVERYPHAARIYPNPASKRAVVSISGERGGKIQMADLYGARMLTIDTKSREETIDIEHLSPGIYFVTVTTPMGRSHARLIKN